ncbi:MAG TPA: metalloregulator ArsR/SmtB family transcription factor [Planctomycetota bacterium]|nr:metalloregulator ArsR/SmtB family transcription factor [Planctomycetota bacterium]
MSVRASRRFGGGALAEAAPVFAALGDATRLDLVSRLSSGGPMSIARLTEGADVTRQAVTKHLHVLAGAGLARGTRVGRDHVWEIDSHRFDDARRWLDHIESQWDEALGRLKASLERPASKGKQTGK